MERRYRNHFEELCCTGGQRRGPGVGERQGVKKGVLSFLQFGEQRAQGGSAGGADLMMQERGARSQR